MSSLAPTTSGFQHEPLVDPKTHIRLLKITEGSLGQRVTCTLTTWPLEEAPPYTAISYTWGEPTNPSTILIDGQPKVVRRNCEYVLHQAWAVSADRFYWVDDICIDQSLTEEKNHQVSMMGDLYKRATRVLACVGEHADDSEFLMHILARYKAYLTRLNGYVYVLDDDFSQVWTGQHFVLSDVPSVENFRERLGLFKYRGRIARACGQILIRPYFSRVWVLQELFSGNGRITFCCGMHHQPLANLFVLDLVVVEWLFSRGLVGYVVDHLQEILPFGSTDMAIVFQTRWLHAEQSAQRGSLAAGAGDLTRSTRLLRLIPFMNHFACENPRDKIYGIRSLIEWHGQTAPIPDYDKDVFSLAVEVMGIIHTQLRWQSTIQHRWIERSMLFLAYSMRSMLRFSTADSLLRDAIRLRRPGLDIPRRIPQSHLQTRQGEFMWWGEALGDNLKLQKRNTHVEIRNHRNEIVAFAPPDTQPGDWFLTCDDRMSEMEFESAFWKNEYYTQQYYWQYGLVVRATQNKKCSIIGPTFRPPVYVKPIKLRDAKFFVFWWDPEDILVLEWRYSKYDPFGTVAEQLDNCFGLRVAVSPDSTMVKGPFEPDYVRKEVSKGAERIFLESDYKG